MGVEGNDGWRLWLDGELVLDQAAVRSYGTRLAPVDWAGGSVHDVRLEVEVIQVAARQVGRPKKESGLAASVGSNEHLGVTLLAMSVGPA